MQIHDNNLSAAASQTRPHSPAEVAWLGLAVFINALYLKLVMPLIFFELDVGSYFGLGWRILAGQKLYTDVLLISGPVHPHIMALFIKLFGYTGEALYYHAFLTSTLSILVTYFMLHKHLPQNMVIFLTMMWTITFHWFFASPLHTTDAYFIALAGTWVLAANLPIRSAKQGAFCGFLCGLTGFIAFMTKPNIGLFFGGAYFATLAFCRHRATSLSAYAAGFLCGAGCVSFMLPSYRDFFVGNFMPYAQKEQSRALKLLTLKFWCEFLYVPFTAVVLIAVRGYYRKLAAWIIFLLMITGAVLGSHFLNTSPWLCLTATLAGFIVLYKAKELRPAEQNKKHRIFCAVMIVITLIQVAEISQLMLAMRKRRAAYVRHKIETPALRGWYGALRWAPAMDQMIPVINKIVPKDDTLLVFDLDMPFLYGLIQNDGYKGIPFVFQLGVWPALDSDLAEKVRSQIIQNPPDWLITYQEKLNPDTDPAGVMFLHKRGFKLNTLAAYYKLDDWILTHYQVIFTAGRYALMKYRGSAAN